MSDIHARLEEMGIDRERLKAAVDNENWGHLVHAFEILSVCGVVLDTWETFMREAEAIKERDDD